MGNASDQGKPTGTVTTTMYTGTGSGGHTSGTTSQTWTGFTDVFGTGKWVGVAGLTATSPVDTHEGTNNCNNKTIISRVSGQGNQVINNQTGRRLNETCKRLTHLCEAIKAN